MEDKKINELLKTIASVKNNPPGTPKSQEFYIPKSLNNFIIVITSIILFVVYALISALLNNSLITYETLHTYLPPIFKIIYFGGAIYFVLRLTQSKKVLVTLFENKMRVAKKLSFKGKLNSLISQVKIARNKFQKMDIPYEQIYAIGYNEGLFSNGTIVIGFMDDKGGKLDFESALDLLEKDDLGKLVKILRNKGIKTIEIPSV